MGVRIRQVLPKTDNYLKEGTKLILINVALALIIGSLTLLIFWIVYRIRLIGFPLPFPVWLILLGTAIPCFIFWFQYGKAFGSFLDKQRFTKGLILGMMGNIPGFIILYIMVNYNSVIRNLLLSPEIYKIASTVFIMFLILMPIMVILGTLEKDK
ncbi:MAG: hypothetical protein GX375_08350 [Clostridiales bacterium]|nr:hypothetical protein [Clostridiales bacterium]